MVLDLKNNYIVCNLGSNYILLIIHAVLVFYLNGNKMAFNSPLAV